MSDTGIQAFDTTIQKTHIWLNEIMKELRWDDRTRAYRLLRATLHALRDRLTAEEAVELGAQLPMLIRGVYFEGWRIAGKPVKERSKEEFLAHVEDAFSMNFEINIEEAVRVVFTMLSQRISAGEIQDIRGILPEDIRKLFPKGAAA